MKPLCLSIALVLCASIAQAGLIYDFNGLTAGMALNGQNDGTVTWSSVHPSYVGNTTVVAKADPADKYVRTNASNEQLVSSLTAGAGHKLYDIGAIVTKITLTYEAEINQYAGWMVGPWMDGIDAFPNTTSKDTEAEHVVQFGVDYVYQCFRIRGVNGLQSARGTVNRLGVPMGEVPVPTLFTLDIDLNGNAGDGSLSLKTKDLTTGIEYVDPDLQGCRMFLTANSPNGIPYRDDPMYDYDNPSKWTGWYFRSVRMVGGDQHGYTWGYHTLDNLTIIPEPATLGLLALGGLALLKKRARGTRGKGRITRIINMKSTHLLVGCLLLMVAAVVAEAATVTYPASHDVMVEWTTGDGPGPNKDSKGYLKAQYSLVGGSVSALVKTYMKFDVPSDLTDPNWLNSATLRLYNDSRNLNEGDAMEIWDLPNSMDGWDEATLDWATSVTSYGNTALPWPPPVWDNNTYRYFAAGEVVGSGVGVAGEYTPMDFTLDLTKMKALLAADNNDVITLTIAAPDGTSYWEDHEDPNNYGPHLTWDYIPEPATLSLLLFGAAGLLARRRRA